MLMISGSIRQSVKMATMNALIEEKKTKGFVEKKKEMSPEERMLEQFKEQAAQEKESDYVNGIANKVMSGRTLSAEEVEYLQQKNPELLKKYQEMQEEKKSYERQLRRCKTKEEVERVRVNKINGYLAQAKSISHNAVIPKAEKKAMLEEIMARLTNMEKVHAKFVKSEQYRKMPREQEMAKERAELQSGRREAVTEMLKETGEDQEDAMENVQTEEEFTENAGEIVSPEEVAEGDDLAKKAMNVIQTALNNLNKYSYNSAGSTVSMELDRDTGKRIDVKK